MPPRKTSSKRDFRDPRNPQDIARGYTAGARGTPKTPTREGPSFMDTLQSLGRQRAAQPPRTPGTRPPLNQHPFAETMGQMGQMGQMGARPSAPIKSGPLRDVTSDAQHAASLAGRLPSETPLAQVLGLNQVSPAGQANLEINRWDPNKRGFYVPDVDRQSPAFTNQQSVPLQVAPMLNVFRNNPQAMESLLYGGHSMPGYQPRRFYDSNQQVDSSNYWEHRIPSPWETYSPIMGGSASHEYDVGAPYGRGYYDWGHLANQFMPTQGMPWPDTLYPSFQQGSKPPWMTDPWNVSPSQYFAEGSMFRTPPRGGL